MCRQAFGLPIGVLASISVVLVSILRISIELNSAIQIAQWKFSSLTDEDGFANVTDPASLALIACAILSVLAFCRSLTVVTKIAWVSLCGFIAIIVHSVFVFIRHISDVGFDTGGELEYFRTGSVLAIAIREAMLSAGIAPITFPGLRHLRNSTPDRLTRGFGMGLLLGWLLRLIYGIMSYLTHFHNDELLAYELQFGDKIDVKIFCFVKILVLLLAASRSIDIGRYTLCQVFRASDSIPREVWITLGVTISIIGAMLVGHGELFGSITDGIEEILTCCLLFIIPGALFIKLYGSRQKLHSTGAAVAVATGLFGIACVIWATVEDHA
jgi:hypothetical protein